MLEPFLLPFCSVAAIADVSLCGRFFRFALGGRLDRISGLMCSPAGLLVTGRGRRRNQSALRMLHPIRQPKPIMSRFLVDGNQGRRKCRVCESADGDDAEVRVEVAFPIERRAAIRAEMKSNLAPLRGVALEGFPLSFDRHLRLREDRAAARHGPGSALAIAAVADAHRERIA